MALAFTNIPESDFSSGIDARSAENQIAPSFVQDLLNADIVEKRARKRPGYQGYAGNLPVRVTGLQYDSIAGEICFSLDTAISLDTAVSLERLRSSPIIVYGRSGEFTSGEGPFIQDVDNVRYYSKFHIPTRKSFIAPSGTLALPGSEHGLGTTNLFVDVVASTSLTNRSYEKVIPDALRLSESDFSVDIDYTISQDTNVYVFFKDQSPGTGEAYVATLTHTGSGSESFSIPTATHNLVNYNIICQIQQDLGTERSQVIPDQVIIAPNGDVTVTLNSVTPATFYAILSAAPIPNTISGAVNASSSGSITISAPTKPWVFFGIYLEQTPGGNKEQVLADTVLYDDINNEFILSFTNEASLARNFTVFYEYGDLRSNVLCVEDADVTVNGSDSTPQLSIWGLDHSEMYIQKQEHEAWVNHIDAYKRSGEQRLVSGLGGNLFSAREYSESATAYLYPNLYPNLFARTSSDRRIGPLFWNTGDTPARSRGYITANDSGTNWVRAISVEYDTNNGWTKYTLSVPNKLILDSSGTPTSLFSVISVEPGLEDYLTVDDMSYARHEGSFKIKQIQDGVNLVYIWVENEDNSSDWNDSGTAGQAGIFTDQVSWLDNSPFVPGDTLKCQSLGSTFSQPVLSSVDGDTVCDDITSLVQIPGGVLFNASRTSSIIPLRITAPDNSPSVENVVRGDMLSYTGIPRLLRVLSVNPDINRSISISTSLGVATATLGTGTTEFLQEGKTVLLQNAGVFTGPVTISEIVSTTEFSFETTETGTSTPGLLLGSTVEVDEQLIWEDTPGDTNSFRVEQRWIPIESPDDSFNQTPSTHVRYFDTNTYSDEPFLRSTMVVDNMYLNNYDDEQYKFDGSTNYRSGLIPWQPGLFLTQETSGATIVTDLRNIAYSAITANEGKLTITDATVNVIPVGTVVRLSGSTETYTVRDYFDDGTDFYVLMDRSLDGAVSATGTVNEIGVYRYYYRLNAIDANDNLIASAVTGYQDHVVELIGNAAVQHKIVGLPSWDVYDYDRLEVQIYRTKMNQVAPFYLVTTLPMSFNNTLGYIQFRDAFADSDLSQLDIVNTALKGQELGTQWSDALRAKYTTSIGNRLVIGNLQDYPQLDIQISADASLSNGTLAGDTLLFRRNNADSLNTTDMINRVKYEWINGFTGTASSFSIGSNQFSFTTSVATAAVPGDWIYLTYATTAVTGRDLTYSGWYQIASVVTTTVTVNLQGAAAATTYPNRYVIATDPTDIPVLLGTDGNMGMFNGDSFDIFDSMRRMSMAINSTMRMVDTSLVSMAGYVPWLVARGGNDLTPAGRLIVRQPRSEQLTPELVPTFSGYSLFVNNIRRLTNEQISASTSIYPSRILASYQNYPEIFDNPTSILDTESDSAIDVNSADGQEITGIIPFFGESAFGAAQQSAVLVVFKSNSIYLVDLNQKDQGQNPVQRIETQGIGCTAPYSIAVSKNGVMFANESGMYCLRRDQSVQYLGRFMERNWEEKVSLTNLDIAHGHHYGQGRLYKLSVPLTSDIDESTGYTEPTQVYVYNHTKEESGELGSWGRYNAHKAIGWANLASNAFWASTYGRVFSIRNTSTVTDFRDDSEGIEFILDTRANDFTNAGIRKVFDKVLVHYRTGANNTGTNVSFAIDLENEYSETSPVVINGQKLPTGIGDNVSKAIQTIVHSLDRRRGDYLSIRISNSSKDESLEIAGIEFKVAGLTSKGILQAAQTETE